MTITATPYSPMTSDGAPEVNAMTGRNTSESSCLGGKRHTNYILAK